MEAVSSSSLNVMMVSLVFRAFSLHGRLLLVRPRLGSRLSGFSLIAVNKILIVSSMEMMRDDKVLKVLMVFMISMVVM